MKCSTCGFIGDPTSDLCSRCYSDLRQHKISLGLQVTNATASYQELLSKRVRIVERAKVARGPNLRNSLFTFFKRFKKTKVIQPREESTPSNVYVIDDAQESAPKAEEGVVAYTQSTEAQKLRLSKRQKEQMVGLLRKRQEDEKPEVLAEQRPVVSANVEARIIPAEDLELWQQSENFLKEVSAKIAKSASISVTSLISQDSNAALAVYFDLAFQELSSPDKKREFVRQLGDRRVDAIASPELQEAVGKYQQDSARQEEESLEDSLPETMIIGVPASNSRRLAAWILDSVVAVAVSLLGGLFFFFKTSPLVSDILLGTTAVGVSEVLSVALYFSQIYIVLILLVFPTFRFIMGFTFGELLTKLRLVTLNQTKIDYFTSINWNLSSIFAFLSLGLVEIRRSGPLWRERLIGAQLLRT